MRARGEFLSDIKEIRRRAREHLSEGAVTQNYGGKVEDAVALLNHAVATEIVCILRYKFRSQGDSAQGAGASQRRCRHAELRRQGGGRRRPPEPRGRHGDRVHPPLQVQIARRFGAGRGSISAKVPSRRTTAARWRTPSPS